LEQEKETLTKRMEKGGVDTESEAASTAQTNQNKPDRSAGGDSSIRQEVTGQSAGSPPSGAAKDQKLGAIAPLPLIKDKATIYFTLNSNEIDPKSYVTLDGIAAYLENHPDQVAYIRGYTDSIGSQTYNESVSRFRASAVKSYLMGKGAPANSLQIFAMGDSAPIASNDTSQGRGLNRRVEIEFPNFKSSDQ
jgi:outer membrane protein OmpA-like peptidoglycan-associated protein